MYLSYYDLKRKPFQITVDPKFLWLGEKHKEALAILRYGIQDNRGFLLLTGEVGTGKTILINQLMTMLDIDTVMATLPDPDLESMDFYNLLSDGFNMGRTFDTKGAFLIHLRDFLHQSYAKKQQVLLTIDESQRLNHSLMEDIRVLSNIELHDRKLINIFFVGQQEFNNILMTPQNRALAQRITVRYHIEPLDLNEIGGYIQHRLQVAGATQQLFDRSAVQGIYHFSGGIPRLINIICDHALLTGYAQGIELINENVIKECAEELRIPIQQPLASGGRPEVDIVLREDNSIEETVKHEIPKLVEPEPTDLDKEEFEPVNQMPVIMGKEEPELVDETVDGKIAIEKRSKTQSYTYGIFSLVLIVVIAFVITQFTAGEYPPRNPDELAPQKYKASLEKKKELLAEGLGNTDLKASDEESAANKKYGTVEESALDQPEDRKQIGYPIPDQAATDSRDLETNIPLPTPKPSNKEKDNSQIKPLPLLEEKIIIQFTINSNEIATISFEQLDRIAEYLKYQPDEVAYIRGYTDSSGSITYNESVSRFRANAVKMYLIGKGVSPDRLKVFAMGANNPIADNNQSEGRRKNRRVEIEFPFSQEIE